MPRDESVHFVGLSGYEYPHTRVRCYNFARELTSLGISTRVLSFHDRLAASLPEAEMYGLSDRRRLWLILRGVLRLLAHRSSALYVQKVHYHAISAFLVSRFTGWPYVLDYDDYEVGNDPYGIPLFCGFKNRYLTRFLFGSNDPEVILRKAAQKALFCVAASRFLENQLKGYTDRVIYIPTGVDTSRFKPKCSAHNSRIVLLWNGVVWGEAIRDNLLLLLNAMRQVVTERTDVLLRIIGQGRYMEDVRQASSSLNLSGWIEFKEWVSPDDMPNELSRADIGLLPLVHSDLWTEGKSPTKLFEYMASGLSVLATARGEAGHVVKHGVDGLLADDEKSFVSLLLELVSSRELRSRLGREATRTIEHDYSMSVLGLRLARALEQYGVIDHLSRTSHRLSKRNGRDGTEC